PTFVAQAKSGACPQTACTQRQATNMTNKRTADGISQPGLAEVGLDMISMVAGWRGRVKLRLCAEKAVPNRCAFIGFAEFHRTPICESRISNQSSRSSRKSRGLFFRQ